MKLLKPLLLAALTLAGIQPFAQQPKWLSYQLSKKVSLETALIKIDNKRSTYNDLLKVADSSLLKVEVYSKKLAQQFVDKDESKNGLVLVTLHKKHFPSYIQKKDGVDYVTNENGDTTLCTSFVQAGINGDTTETEWRKFLMADLNPQVPANNSAPAGIYNVDVSFMVNLDSSVSNLTILEDPGYGTAAEVKGLMSKSPAWTPGSCNGVPVKFRERQRIMFVVTEQ